MSYSAGPSTREPVTANFFDIGFLYKIKTDGTEKSQLNCDVSTDINVVGDWVFYMTSNDYSGSVLYKIRTDGTERQKVK